tara:strand:+ start:255 stop:425 length:171 start_codon:yes stop_codon:yes gene_type:complete
VKTKTSVNATRFEAAKLARETNLPDYKIKLLTGAKDMTIRRFEGQGLPVLGKGVVR